ncbi:MAG: CopD family protein [Hyphomonas sp.]|jgi:putative copper export protein|nr:CopD family protein [Hyphomonas sp.]
MPLLDAANLATKILLYGASLAAIGAALHGALGLHTNRRAYTWLAALVAATALIRLLILNAQMGGSLDAALSLDQFGWTWAGGGRPALALFAGAVLLFAASIAKGRILPMLAAVSISAGFGLTGHTAGLEAPGLAPWVVAVHVLIAGFWLAAPVTLWPAPAMNDRDVLARAESFSRVARFIVPLLFVSGVYLFWRINGDLTSALSSGYGRLLTAKFLAALLILGLGALNMTRVTHQLATDAVSGRANLRATLRVDAVLFVLILGIIAAATTISGPVE